MTPTIWQKLLLITAINCAFTLVEFVLMRLFHTPALTSGQELSIWTSAYAAGILTGVVWKR